MSDIDELERRISSALERISNGLDALQIRAADSRSLDRLEEELEAERAARAQIAARLESVEAAHGDTLARLEQQVERLMAQIDSQDDQMRRLRSVNAELRRINGELRDRNARMLADPAAINGGIVAELEALRATRAAEVAEMDEILSELQPLVEEERMNA
jgi:chromosome segregation ATPase